MVKEYPSTLCRDSAVEKILTSTKTLLLIGSPPNSTLVRHQINGVSSSPSSSTSSSRKSRGDSSDSSNRSSRPRSRSFARRLLYLLPQSLREFPTTTTMSSLSPKSASVKEETIKSECLENSQAYDDLYSFQPASSSSGNTLGLSRDMRNKAEKLRRDKLNKHIVELGEILPAVKSTPKRLDKTSILRLAANFLRVHRNIVSLLSGNQRTKWPSTWVDSLLESSESFLLVTTGTGKILHVSEFVEKLLGHAQSSESFLLVTTGTGKILHVSEFVEKLLGHAQVDLLGHQVYVIVHPDDRGIFAQALHPQPGNRDRKVSQNQLDDWLFLGIASPVKSATILGLTLYQTMQDEYYTRHMLDGRIVNSDQRISLVAGYTVEEVLGKSGFSYVLSEDKTMAALLHREMLFSSRDGSAQVTYRLRTKTDEFVYLKTKGFLEFNRSNDAVESFICINAMISDAEGRVEMRRQVELYRNSPLLRQYAARMETNGSWMPPNQVAQGMLKFGSQTYSPFVPGTFTPNSPIYPSIPPYAAAPTYANISSPSTPRCNGNSSLSPEMLGNGASSASLSHQQHVVPHEIDNILNPAYPAGIPLSIPISQRNSAILGLEEHHQNHIPEIDPGHSSPATRPVATPYTNNGLCHGYNADDFVNNEQHRLTNGIQNGHHHPHHHSSQVTVECNPQQPMTTDQHSRKLDPYPPRVGSIWTPPTMSRASSVGMILSRSQPHETRCRTLQPHNSSTDPQQPSAIESSPSFQQSSSSPSTNGILGRGNHDDHPWPCDPCCQSGGSGGARCADAGNGDEFRSHHGWPVKCAPYRTAEDVVQVSSSTENPNGICMISSSTTKENIGDDHRAEPSNSVFAEQR
ncbi:unnamed protein product [Notodromas monacha]|uniref:Uncharacterized protein n=1 Tax=Notodromas monacha TaxID=399045 RepID=A0A7R9BHS4_9CRUS|nr:unnamed protein product [Notodromas monacha]CAG0914141.1 unnamed protein product [Notodromas monacha]